MWFSSSKERNRVSLWAAHRAATSHRTLLLPKSHQSRRRLSGLRAEGVPAVSSPGEEGFKLGIPEQRGKNPLSAKEGTDKKVSFLTQNGRGLWLANFETL